MEKRKRMTKRKVIIENYFGSGEHLFEDQLGWSKREKMESRSFVSKEIFDFEIVKVGLNMAFYYVDNDTFYGIHTERTPIEVKVLPRDTSDSPYVNSQCKGDTHVHGDILFAFQHREELWDGIIIEGKSLEEVLNRSYIITLN